MEKSFFNFKSAHPSWECPTSGQHLVDRVTSYQQTQQELALEKEQQIHIDAAARQLETLHALERKRFTTNSNYKVTGRAREKLILQVSTKIHCYHPYAKIPYYYLNLLSIKTYKVIIQMQNYPPIYGDF